MNFHIGIMSILLNGDGGSTSIKIYDTFSEFPTAGTEGIIYIAKDTGDIYTWRDATSNYIPAGDTGIRGSLWYSGAGSPTSISGQLNDDLYLNTANDDIYQLQSGIWTLIGNIKGGKGDSGTNACVYIAYASDAIGTDFTNTFNPALDYIAVLATTTPITTPIASDFTGLWKDYSSSCISIPFTDSMGFTYHHGWGIDPIIEFRDSEGKWGLFPLSVDPSNLEDVIVTFDRITSGSMILTGGKSGGSIGNTLTATGEVVGATYQAQVFTNGVQLSNLTADRKSV